MYKRLCLILVMVLTIGLIVRLAYDVNAEEVVNGNRPLRKIVVFKQGVVPEMMERVIVREGAKVIKHLPLIKAMAIMLPAERPEQAKRDLMRETLVVRVDDDIVVHAIGKPDNLPKPPKEDKPQPSQKTPWGVGRIGADSAWYSSRGKEVKVAILDTGIDLDHPDLQANIAGGINTINSKKSANDDNGHGTHCAGIIAAINNEIGVVGVAPEAHLYAVKVLDRNGNGWLSDIIEGLQWTIDNNIQVNSMSFGTDTDNSSFREAIKLVYNAGITQVAAAGNNGAIGGAICYPAKYSEVIAVSAIDQNDDFAGFSSYGQEIDLTAPGVKINSTYKDSEYKELDGTSMACPHVTGTVALRLYYTPSLSPVEIKDVLTSTAEELLNLSEDQQGKGLVDAENLIVN